MKSIFYVSKKIIFVFLISFLLLYGCKGDEKNLKMDLEAKKEMILDLDRSIINWKVYKNNSQHSGTLKFLRGSFKLEGGLPVSGSCLVDMNSIKIEDIKDTVENNRIIEYLKSKNFLFTEKFPQATVEIRSIVPLRVPTMPSVNTTIKGSIAIKDSTLSMAVTALTSYYRDSIVSRSKFSLNGANWNLPLKSINIDKDYKDNPYKEDFDIEVFVVAK